MSNWLDGSNVGDYAFTDGDGIKRYRGRTCNVYGSVQDVVAGFAFQRGRGATIYVYRTRDGLFDGAVRPVPTDDELRPEFVGATLVHIERGSFR